MKLLRLFTLAFATSGAAFAGGPLGVGGPNFGSEGVPFTWDLSGGPITYRVDGGPMAKNPSGTIVIDHAPGVSRVDSMFGTWSSVPTANLQYQNAGGLIAAGSVAANGDVDTVAKFQDVSNSCDQGVQSPVIFDADGSILKALGVDGDVIGFVTPCSTNGSHFSRSMVVLNGAFQDGVDTSTNGELTSAQFDEAITHEIGHFSGLDHAQINVEVLMMNGNCSIDFRAGLPIMFPFAVCQARTTAGLPALSPDDIAWISYFYPNASFNSSYGFIEGEIRFSDGITPVQGVNIIARSVSDPTRVAVSVVSGFLFTDEPGQTVSGDNNNGGDFGSRAANREGYFKIPVPAGDWRITLEPINGSFTAGSSVGPLSRPVPMPGTSPGAQTVTVTVGQTTTVNFTLVGTPPRFDLFEDESLLVIPSVPYVREEEVTA
jgi:hypothetical protein